MNKLIEDTRQDFCKSLNLPKQLLDNKSFVLQFRNYTILKKVKELLTINLGSIQSYPIMYIKKKPINIANLFVIGSKLYIAGGDVPVSADGEFRAVFTKVENIQTQDVEKSVVKDAKIVHDFINKNSKYISCDFKLSKEKLFHILFHIISEIFHFASYGSYPVNYSTDVYSIFKKAVSEWEHTPHYNYGMRFNISRPDIKDPNNIILIIKIIGCKIVPLHINDARNFKKHGTITEIEINNKVTALKENCILLNCPALINWSIFKITTNEIFSSAELREKYKKSAEYVKMIKKLYDAGNIEGELEIIKSFKKKLEIPILYAEKNMILSNYCSMFIFETLGRTLTDFIIRKSDNGEEFFLSNLAEMKSFVLQLIFTFYVFNEHINIVHGDMHFNNITVQDRVDVTETIIYHVGGKNYGVVSKYIYYIIDFGRAIQNPASLIDNKRKEYIDMQNNRLLKFFGRVVPETYVENKAELNNLIKTNANEVFHISKALDIFYVLSNIKSILGKYLIPSNFEFINGILKHLIGWIRENINGLIQRKNIDATNPNLMLIEKYYDVYTGDMSDVRYYCNGDRHELVKNINVDRLYKYPEDIKKKFAVEKKNLTANIDRVVKEANNYQARTGGDEEWALVQGL